MSRKYWYAYQGGGDETDPGNYSKTTSNPTYFCPTGTVACVIYADPNPLLQNQPNIISASIQSYLLIAESLNIYWPMFPDKPYVYTKKLI